MQESPDEVPSTLTGALTGPSPLPPKSQSSPHMPANQGSLYSFIQFIQSFLGGLATVPRPKQTTKQNCFQTPLACQFRQILIPMPNPSVLLLRYIWALLISRCTRFDSIRHRPSPWPSPKEKAMARPSLIPDQSR